MDFSVFLPDAASNDTRHRWGKVEGRFWDALCEVVDLKDWGEEARGIAGRAENEVVMEEVRRGRRRVTMLPKILYLRQIISTTR